MRKSYRTAILAECEKAKAIAVAAEQEDRDLTDTERDTIEAHLKKAGEIDAAGKREAELQAQRDDLIKGLGIGAETGELPDPAKATSARAKERAKTIGEQFIASDEWKTLVKSRPGGNFGEKSRVQSGIVQYKDLFTGADHDTSAGALVRPDYRGLLDPFYERPLSIRDIVASGNTTSDTIEYVRLVSTTNNAAVVPEATTTAAVGSGAPVVTPEAAGIKPESGFVFEKDTTTVKTVAHWIPATKRALSDAAQVRTLIDSFLRYGLEEALEDELVGGDGTGEHFLGILNTSGVQTQAAPVAGQDVFDVTRMARRKVRIGGRANPSAFVFNPIDWEDVELRRDANGVFYGAGPFAMTPARLWGLPVIESEAIPAGTAFVGDWNYAVLYDREQASIQVTDSHADFFIRNLVAILAELRAAFAILRPPAFVRIDLG
jgi:HK97 family phage major capsid protein